MLIDSADAAADAAGMAFVKHWQQRVPYWWLMYSRRKRRLVAFYQGNCPPPGLVVEAAHPDELLERMSREAQALWRSPASQTPQPHSSMESSPGPGEGAGS
ncbi:hypothetical protein [Nonomuraea sp. NPDC049480]|uniref:hypothetical protein n=1 Tax=Nonomuraea sp. NPDC049480 TaxID=3364353 RepID=UPI00378FF374